MCPIKDVSLTPYSYVTTSCKPMHFFGKSSSVRHLFLVLGAALASISSGAYAQSADP